MKQLPPDDRSFVADVAHCVPPKQPAAPVARASKNWQKVRRASIAAQAIGTAAGGVRRASVLVQKAGTEAADGVKRATLVTANETVTTGADLYDCWFSSLTPGKCHVVEAENSCHEVLQVNRSAALISKVGSGVVGNMQRVPVMKERFFPEYEEINPDSLVQLSQMELDKVMEFRLCLEMLRDCLDTYWDDHGRGAPVLGIDAHHDAMILNPAAETFHSANDILVRILELGLWRKLSADDPQLNAVHTVASLKDFQQSFSASGLQLDEFFEGVLGELSRWQLGPNEEEEARWREWQIKYNTVMHHLHRIAQDEQTESGPCGVWCRGDIRSCVVQETKVGNSRLCCVNPCASLFSSSRKSQGGRAMTGNGAPSDKSSITTELSAFVGKVQQRRKDGSKD